MLKVVHIQKSILSTGRAPLRLHNALLEENIESTIISMEYDVNLNDKIIDAGPNPRIIAKLDNYIQSFILRRSNKDYGSFSYPVLGTNVSVNDWIKKADIIYIHWALGGFLNLKGYRLLGKLGKPVIIFMHDMWSITGGCHHSFSCQRYRARCRECPIFPKESLFDWPAMEYNRKKRLYSDFNNLYFVSPSKWLKDCAKLSSLTKDKPVFHIPNIVDTELFKSVDKKFARQVLSIKEEETIIAFGAFSITSPYKGWPELLNALRILSNDYSYKDSTILIFGAGYKKEIADSIPFKTRFLGFLKDEYSTVMVYNSADVLVTPSLADNFPTTVLECQACGTPVVGFDIGGIPDMIIHKRNGYLAKYGDVDDLVKGIKFCIENKLKGQLLPEFNKHILVNKHIDMMKSILT